MTPVRWLLFDVGGVLCQTDGETWPATLESNWARRLGISHAEFARRIKSAELPDAAHRIGVIDHYWAAYGAAVEADERQLEAMQTEFWEAYCGRADRALLEYVGTHHGHLGLAILSNSADGAREKEEARFQFSKLFDPILYSHEIGVSKPDPKAFKHSLAEMRANSREVIFIDNLAENVAAAESIGMRGVVHTSTPDTVARIDELIAMANSHVGAAH